MPSGERYRVTHKGVKYDLSPEQFNILKEKSHRYGLPLHWNTEQRIKGLRVRGLLKLSSQNSKSVTYQRTLKGSEILKAITSRS